MFSSNSSKGSDCSCSGGSGGGDRVDCAEVVLEGMMMVGEVMVLIVMVVGLRQWYFRWCW